MNTKLLMTTSSLVLGLGGIFALFAPDVLLTTLGVPIANPLYMIIQLMGALYFSIAMMNWTAKDSIIGGIYARPISLGNFAHFFSGTLLLAKYVLSNAFHLSILLSLIGYMIFAGLFTGSFFDIRGLWSIRMRHHNSTIGLFFVVHPLSETQRKNKINCVQEGVQDGTDKKEL